MKNVMTICILLFWSFLSAISAAANNEIFRPDERLARGRALSREGDFEGAIAEYLAYYSENPEEHRILAKIPGLYQKAGQIEEAIEFAEKLLIGDEYPTTGEYFYSQFASVNYLWSKIDEGKVSVIFGKNNWQKTGRKHYLAVLEDVDSSDRMKIVAYLMLGQIENTIKDSTGAREYYLAALELISPPEDQWQKGANDVLLHEAMSIRNYNDAIAIYRNHPRYRYLQQLGDWLVREGRGFEMIEIYEDYVFLDEVKIDENAWFPFNEYRLMQTVINELVRVGQGERLLKLFSQLTSSNNVTSRVYRNYAYLFFKLKRNEECIVQLENYLSALDSPTFSDYRLVGALCNKGGMLDEAIGYYEVARVKEITPEEIRAESRHSQISFSDDRWEARYRIRILESLGNLYLKKGRTVDAEGCFKEIVTLQTKRDNVNAQATLSKIWEDLGKENELVEDMKSKVAEDPKNLDLRIEYGNTLSKAGKSSLAVEQYEKALELSGRDMSVRLKLADALAADKQNEKAIAEYEKVLLTGLSMGQDQFRRGKVSDPTMPRRVLHLLERFCKRCGEEERLLKVYYTVLDSLEVDETKWQPTESVMKGILRDVTEILESKGDYNGAVRLWLDYRGQFGRYCREVVQGKMAGLNAEEISGYADELKKADDLWAKFILADILSYENHDDKALEIYTWLLAEPDSNKEITFELSELFENMMHDDLAMKALVKGLDYYEQGSNSYGYWSGVVAQRYLRLGEQKDAEKYYRMAIRCEISKSDHQKYQRGLFKATDGKEGIGEADLAAVKSVEDLRTVKTRLDSMRSEKDYAGMIKLCEKIIDKAPTAIEIMAYMGEAYYKMGDVSKAKEIFEKIVFDDEFRVWSHGGISDYTAYSGLLRIYQEEKNIEKQVSLFAVSGRGGYRSLFGRLKSRQEFGEFDKCVMEQLEKTPRSIGLRLFLVEYFQARGDQAKAVEVVAGLRDDMVGSDGLVDDSWRGMRLPVAYEKIGMFKEALEVMPVAEFEKKLPSNNFIADRLMRLYMKTGQLEKSFAFALKRLRADDNEYQTVKIAENIAKGIHCYADRGDLLDKFLGEIKSEISVRIYKRFAGTIKANLAACDKNEIDKDKIIDLLKNGHDAVTPKKCKSFAMFLEELAYQADTIATQSFMGKYGQKKWAPRVSMKKGSAFEILAAAIDGTNIPFSITQEGYWAFYESDNKKKIRYGASGGVFCELWEANRYDDSEQLQFGGRLKFSPEVRRNIASIQSTFTVVEAIDNKGRNIPVHKVESQWDGSTQIDIPLSVQNPAAKSIKKLRVKTQVAIGTKWVTFKVDRLDHKETIVLEKDGVRIEIEPIKEVEENSKKRWKISTDIRRKNIALDARTADVNDEIYYMTKTGKKMYFDMSSYLRSANHTKIALNSEFDSFDPATTSLYIREPAAIEILPFELTFKDIPVIRR